MLRWLGLLLAFWSGSALAQPFSERELSEALAARVSDVARADVRIERVGELFVVTLAEKSRVLDLAGSSGVDAARVVALVVSDLAQLEAPTVRPLAPTVRYVPAKLDRWRLGIDGAVSHGLQSDDLWGFKLGLHGDLAVRRLALTLQSAYWTMPTERARYTSTEVRFDALALHAGVGVASPRYGLTIGPVYAHAWVRGRRTHTSELFGASLQGSIWLPASEHVRLGVRIFLDAYVRRSFFQAGRSGVLIATPAAALGIALTVAWGWA